MSSATLYRLSGISLLIGSLLVFVGTVLGLVAGPDQANTLNVSGSLIRALAVTLIVLGLPGVYARQAHRAGTVGLVGFITIMLYLLLMGVFGDLVLALVLPWLATQAPALAQGGPPPGVGIAFMAAGLLGVVGGVTLGIDTMRATVLPRWAGLLILIGPVVQFAGDAIQSPIADLGLLVLMVGLAWLGLSVASAPQQATVAQAEPAGGALRA